MKNLSPLEIDDLTTLSSWLEQEEIYKNLYALYHPMTYNQLVTWYNKKIEDGDHIYKYTTDGTYYDILRYGVLRSEYFKN